MIRDWEFWGIVVYLAALVVWLGVMLAVTPEARVLFGSFVFGVAALAGICKFFGWENG